MLTYAPIDNVAEQTDQGKACDNDYGDGDADMGYGGDDGQDLWTIDTNTDNKHDINNDTATPIIIWKKKRII